MNMINWSSSIDVARICKISFNFTKFGICNEWYLLKLETPLSIWYAIDDQKMHVHVCDEFIFSLLALQHGIHEQHFIVHHLSSCVEELLNRLMKQPSYFIQSGDI